ncbi:hypothetical protein HQQ80_01855 [Microbacteriaceae bacterium VKM Ac-2855]|nr:hypothetical protein [Microbacteriaceae bacterium VKM Ac-2855]
MTAQNQLREWAAGERPRVAATEVLIRSGLAEDTDPWVLYDAAWKTRAIDFDAITETAIADRPSTHRHLLRIIASLGAGTPVNLWDEVAGLDYTETELVMIAIAHAAGFSEMTSTLDDSDGTPRVVPTPPLASWPD